MPIHSVLSKRLRQDLDKTTEEGKGMTEDRLVFWGTGDAMGVPRVYCECSVCEEARTEGVNRRMRSMVAVENGEGRFLIDCGPDWRMQMEQRGIRTVERILVTHPHFDHIGGLPEWADQCRWTGIRGELYAPSEVLEAIRERYPWLERNLDLFATEPGLVLGGWNIAGWRVNHGKNGYSYAYRLEKQNFAWVYCPDSIGLSGAEIEPMRRADLLVLGTSFVYEDAEYSTRSVYDMREAAELLDEIRPIRTIYTHMSHDVDLNRLPELPRGVSTARTGLEVPLQQENEVSFCNDLTQIEYTEGTIMEKEQKHRNIDPTDDETTNLKDDGSTDPRPIEKASLAEDKRPDAHIGTIPGQVDERMADAAAQIRQEHEDEQG